MKEDNLKIIFAEQEEIDEIRRIQRLRKYAAFANLTDEIIETVDVLYPGLKIDIAYSYDREKLPFGVTESTIPVFSFLSFYPPIDLYDEFKGYLRCLRHTFLAKEEAQDIFLYLIHPTKRETEII